jgi:hypothetical protein
VGRVIGVDELTVDDEERIEEAPLGELGQVDVVVDVNAGVLRDAGVLPQPIRTRAADTIGVQAEVKLAGHLLSFSTIPKFVGRNNGCPTTVGDDDRSAAAMNA